MTRRIAPLTQTLPIPPSEYNADYMRRLINVLQRMAHNQEYAAVLHGGWLNLSDIRPDAYNLVPGDFFQDASYVRVVRGGDYGTMGVSITSGVGAVTVTTT